MTLRGFVEWQLWSSKLVGIEKGHAACGMILNAGVHTLGSCSKFRNYFSFV